MASASTQACDLPSKSAADLPLPADDLTPETAGEPAAAIFAGGCFWCTEAVFRKLRGVSAVVSGYIGGDAATANYQAVCNGSTQHAEAIKITYDPHQITFGQLMRVLFTVIDPTTKDRQGPDHGTQYRSAIFYESPRQQEVAAAYIKQLDGAGVFAQPIATTIEPTGDGFFPAEDYHQDYVTTHPDEPYIVQTSRPKVGKLREHFADALKPGE